MTLYRNSLSVSAEDIYASRIALLGVNITLNDTQPIEKTGPDRYLEFQEPDSAKAICTLFPAVHPPIPMTPDILNIPAAGVRSYRLTPSIGDLLGQGFKERNPSSLAMDSKAKPRRSDVIH